MEVRLALRDALLALPPGKRVMLVLRYLEDLPETQVADILGCSVGTVRSQTHKAIAQLRSVLPPARRAGNSMTSRRCCTAPAKGRSCVRNRSVKLS